MSRQVQTKQFPFPIKLLLSVSLFGRRTQLQAGYYALSIALQHADQITLA